MMEKQFLLDVEKSGMVIDMLGTTTTNHGVPVKVVENHGDHGKVVTNIFPFIFWTGKNWEYVAAGNKVEEVSTALLLPFYDGSYVTEDDTYVERIFAGYANENGTLLQGYLVYSDVPEVSHAHATTWHGEFETVDVPFNTPITIMDY